MDKAWHYIRDSFVSTTKKNENVKLIYHHKTIVMAIMITHAPLDLNRIRHQYQKLNNALDYEAGVTRHKLHLYNLQTTVRLGEVTKKAHKSSSTSRTTAVPARTWIKTGYFFSEIPSNSASRCVDYFPFHSRPERIDFLTHHLRHSVRGHIIC